MRHDNFGYSGFIQIQVALFLREVGLELKRRSVAERRVQALSIADIGGEVVDARTSLRLEQVEVRRLKAVCALGRRRNGRPENRRFIPGNVLIRRQIAGGDHEVEGLAVLVGASRSSRRNRCITYATGCREISRRCHGRYTYSRLDSTTRALLVYQNRNSTQRHRIASGE